MCKTNALSIRARWFCIIAVIVSALIFSATPGGAHQSPVDCTENSLRLYLLKDKTNIDNGETVTYAIQIGNDATGACDITGATATLTCPDAAGTPNGLVQPCGAPNQDYPAGTQIFTLCQLDCVVTVNPGVTLAQAKGEVHGILHDNPANDLDTADVVLFISVVIEFCGNGNVGNTPGETCDPPGSAAGASGNICRDDCTVCGDGTMNGGEDCDDGNNVPGDGCENDCTPTQPEAICRGPGFWGTHAGTEKTRSKNITEAIIDCADGNCADHTVNDYLLICGEKIDSPDSNPADGTTDWDDASSSTEALCVPVKGAQILQLARQLTAGALNCIMSNGDETCASTPLYATVFADCNTTCADSTATKEELTACISELDCLNNGKTFANGLCLDPVPGNCYERQLVNEALGLDFEPPGPAGSPDACQAAHATNCNVVGPAEGSPQDGAHCGTDSLP